jgi:GNAT superfamily N-acetyltransferase
MPTSANATTSDGVVVERGMRVNDEPLIFATWLNSYAQSAAGRMVDRPLYFYEQKRVIERLLMTSDVILAANGDLPDQAYGWIVGEKPTVDAPEIAIVHFMFVKSEYREMGIARALLARIIGGAQQVFFTHLPPKPTRPKTKTRAVIGTPGELVQKLQPRAVYNPYLAYRRTR